MYGIGLPETLLNDQVESIMANTNNNQNLAVVQVWMSLTDAPILFTDDGIQTLNMSESTLYAL